MLHIIPQDQNVHSVESVFRVMYFTVTQPNGARGGGKVAEGAKTAVGLGNFLGLPKNLT